MTDKDLTTTNEPQQLVLHIPLPEELRAMPWITLRSALSTAVKPGDRKLCTRKKIAALGKNEIRYTGHQLDQADLDVYEQVLFMARERLDTPIEFQTKTMLTSLRRDTGKSQRDWLFDALSRLTACEIEFKCGNLAYAGSLIQEHGRDDATGTHYVIVNPRIATLYYNDDTGGTYSIYKREERLKLGRKSLAKWLHGFVAGNASPFTLSIEKLQALSGSAIKLERMFRQQIDKATEEVNAVYENGQKLRVQWNLAERTVTFELSKPKK